MDDESGESMKTMGEVPLVGLMGESTAWLTERSRELISETVEGRHNRRNYLLFVEKMMYMDERV